MLIPTSIQVGKVVMKMEAEAGIEPTNGGFAIHSITTLLLGQNNVLTKTVISQLLLSLAVAYIIHKLS